MKKIDLSFFKKISVIITPNIPDKSTNTYKLSLLRGSAYILLYTLIAWLFLIFILSVTPIKDFLFVLDNQELIEQREKINVLQENVNKLTRELEKIVVIKERMKHAMILAEKDSIDSQSKLYDTLQTKIQKKINIGGNVFPAFIKLIELFKKQDDEKKEVLFFQEPVYGGIVTQRFNAARGHLGIDYGLKNGSPIYAASGGFVIYADYNVDYGYMMIIQHNNEFTTIYKHCSSLLKKTQDVVRMGELIALSGNSGKNTTGPHLHFEIWYKGKPVDPEKYFIK